MSDHDIPDNNQSKDDSGATSAVDNDKPQSVSAALTGELSPEAKAKLAELDDTLKKYESQKRWSDVIKTIIAKVELIPVAEKVSLLIEAGKMYIERSANQVEAIKCFQRVLEYDAHNIEAITFLKDIYEKRRDWAHLVEIMRTECEMLEPQDQAPRYQEIADLATERVRKPEVCIDLWQKVLQADRENSQALASLAGLYERAREWEKLAEVLEKQSEQISDAKELSALLQKLGGIYGDKLNQDQGAIRSF